MKEERVNRLLDAVSQIRTPGGIASGIREGVLDLRRESRAAERLADALRSILFQVTQGKVLERDACIGQSRAALAAWDQLDDETETKTQT